MTALSVAHAGKPDGRHPDRWAAPTIRLRTEGTDHLLAAAETTGVSHIVAQSLATWNAAREGGWVTEDDLLPPEELPEKSRTSVEALRYVEEVVVVLGLTEDADERLAQLTRGSMRCGGR